MTAAEGLTVRDLFDAWLRDGVRRKDGNKELRRAFGADALLAMGDQRPATGDRRPADQGADRTRSARGVARDGRAGREPDQ